MFIPFWSNTGAEAFSAHVLVDADGFGAAANSRAAPSG
jgi:hypothetical protein